MKHGGRRDGAGRKPVADKTFRLRVSLSPAVAEFLLARGAADEIESLVRQSQEFQQQHRRETDATGE
jgi:hypothetical protein